jgi:hypothetical protein
MGTIQDKASSTKGRNLASLEPDLGREQWSRTNSRLARGPPQAVGAPSTPEAQLGQASSRSNLGQIALPTDRVAGAFNAKIT